MPRRRRHPQEEHLNHEAWAIPYGDLVTLLLAFFVVMYAVSSVNAGKYRVMADAMSTAFGGTPSALTPVQLGEMPMRGLAFERSVIAVAAQAGPVVIARPGARQLFDMPALQPAANNAASVSHDRTAEQLGAIGQRVEHALSDLVAKGLVTVRRTLTTLEIEIQSDLLFASGEAEPSAAARATLAELAMLLRDEPNNVRVEGYTDNLPIRTVQFRSNWELSAARAASVVHVLAASGIAEPRLAVIGYGEHQPVADNATVVGRNANRRVQLVILGASQPAQTATPARSAAPTPALVAAGAPRSPPQQAPHSRFTALAAGHANAPTIGGGH